MPSARVAKSQTLLTRGNSGIDSLRLERHGPAISSDASSLFNVQRHVSWRQELTSMNLHQKVQAGSVIDPRTIVVTPKSAATASVEGVKEENRPTSHLPVQAKGEKGVVVAPPITSFATNGAFMAAVFRDQPEHGTPAICSKRGSPESGGWYPEAATDLDRQCPSSNNNYFNCSTFHTKAEGQLRATKEQFGAYHALVLDDVGTKVAEERLGSFPVTWKIETSPSNYQIGIVLDPPLTDGGEVERLQKAVVKAGLCDPGAKGLGRWARLPVGINGKEKYRSPEGAPFECSMTVWQPDRRYALEEIVAGLGLTLSVPAERKKSPIKSGGKADNAVCTYPKAINPVIAALQARGLYKREIEPGKHDITCPWSHDHTDALDTGAAVWEPNNEYPLGGFRCLHSHGDGLSVHELLSYLEVNPADARNRRRIRLLPGSMLSILSAAEEALAATGRIFQAGGAIVAVRKDPDGKDLRTEPLTPESLLMEMAGAVEWERYDAKAKEWVLTDPQLKHAHQLLKAQSFAHLPVLRGLARQPYMRGSDQALVLSPGYDPTSRIYGVFDPKAYQSIGTSRQDAEAALNRLLQLLEEFHFESETDRSAAVCAMITAAVRPSLPLAPAFNITASRPGSGKSYLASIIIKFATAGDPLNVSYPRTSEEATKSILSHLLQGPAAIVFDDMDHNWKPFGPINRMLTSETVTDRLLGVNKSATVGTQTLVLGTGNNVEPERDLRRRVLSIRIESRSENPALLRYQGNPLAAVSTNRERCVSDVLTVLTAWRESGSPRTPVFDIASYGGAWSDLCRNTLLWLGLPDPAESLRQQLVSNPDDETLGELLRAWHSLLGEQPITLRKLLQRAGNPGGDPLMEALEDLPCDGNHGINRSKLGWYLKKQAGRIVGGLKLENAHSTERKAWRVVAVPDRSSPPPSAPPIASFEGGEGGDAASDELRP